MKTLRRFIEEDGMDFDEAAKSAVAKRKFLINRVKKTKPLPDESEDDKEEENNILVTETWISHVTLIRIWFSRFFIVIIC